MVHLFFNLDCDFANVSKRFYTTLGVGSYKEGESANVLGGSYYDFSVFGVTIKLEENCYEYEDDYKYMITIRKDKFTESKIDSSVVDLVGKIVSRLLVDNEQIDVAYEVNDGIEIISSDVP